MLGFQKVFLKSCSKSRDFNDLLFFRGFALLLSPGEFKTWKTNQIRKSDFRIWFVFQVLNYPGLSSRANPLKNSRSFKSRDLEQLFRKTFWNPSIERKVTACAILLCGRGGTYNSRRIQVSNFTNRLTCFSGVVFLCTPDTELFVPWRITFNFKRSRRDPHESDVLKAKKEAGPEIWQ